MELTIIETSAYLELKRQLSTLSVQVEDLAGKWLHLFRTNEWTRRRQAAIPGKRTVRGTEKELQGLQAICQINKRHIF